MGKINVPAFSSKNYLLPPEYNAFDNAQAMAVTGTKAFQPRKSGEGEKKMSNKSSRINIPEAREAMDKFKMEAASEVGVDLKEGYNGNLTSREAGSVGGQMVKKMIESYEKNL
jgi:small acid-soluble spore protein D (minor alpha/beta-type SASP)